MVITTYLFYLVFSRVWSHLLAGEGTEKKYASYVFNTDHLRAQRVPSAWRQYLIDQMLLPIKGDISFNYTNDGIKVSPRANKTQKVFITNVCNFSRISWLSIRHTLGTHYADTRHYSRDTSTCLIYRACEARIGFYVRLLTDHGYIHFNSGSPLLCSCMFVLWTASEC